jgi:hypothetical protein
MNVMCHRFVAQAAACASRLDYLFDSGDHRCGMAADSSSWIGETLLILAIAISSLVLDSGLALTSRATLARAQRSGLKREQHTQSRAHSV